MEKYFSNYNKYLWQPNENSVDAVKNKYNKKPPLANITWSTAIFGERFESGPWNKYHYGKDPEGKYLIEIRDYYNDGIADRVIIKELDKKGQVIKKSEDCLDSKTNTTFIEYLK